MDGITNALSLLVTVLLYNTGFGLKRDKLSKRVDDLELDVLTERIERRKSFRNIEHSLENIEVRLNISLAQEGPSAVEIQHIEGKLNEIKELLGTTKLAEISETFHRLTKGFSAEKKQSLRFRRRVSEIEDVLASLGNNSERLTGNMFALLEDSREKTETLKEINEGLRETNEGLRETNEGLRETNKIMKEMYENTSNALLRVTDVLESMSKKMGNVVHVSTALETTKNETMEEYSLEFRQKMKKTRCQVSQQTSCLDFLKCGYTESGVYSVFLDDHEKRVKILSGSLMRLVQPKPRSMAHIRQEMKEIHCHLSSQRYDETCLGLLKDGYSESDVYSVCLGDHDTKVFCDQTSDGGGWTVFQRRQDGSVDFYLGWEEYRNGFGDPRGEFWLGNENLHRLLSVKSLLSVRCRYELRVDLADFDGNTAYAKYNHFMVGPENENYVLTAEGYSGDAGDSLAARHNGQQFSTKDRDNDRWSDSCSQYYKGGWWYNLCHNSNLNGLYSTEKQRSSAENVCWYHWKNGFYPLKFSEMKFREHM